MSNFTASQLQAAKDVVITLGQAIVAAGPGGIPSGHLYAMTCGHLSLEAYQSAIGLLKRTGLVTEEGHVLKINLNKE